MNSHPKVRFALTGAAGGYARTLLAQSALSKHVEPAVLCDRDTDKVFALCRELGYSEHQLQICTPSEDLESIPDETIAIVPDLEMLINAQYEVLVEATGNPTAGTQVAREALAHQRHVVMVSKEVESVSGVELAEQARSLGVVYTPAHGDQPANLIEWYERVTGWGLEVVALGKSGEYDLIYSTSKATLSYLDREIPAPEMAELLDLGSNVQETLNRRAELATTLPRKAAADYCEMAVVASWTGTSADTESMHYPIARIQELADIYSTRLEGGILNAHGIVDVFSALRVDGEASFAGGVFVVVRTHDSGTWEILRGKGHVVSRSGRFACLYLPYHLMGIETVETIFAASQGRAVSDRMPTSNVLLAGRAETDLPSGTVLHMGGHHHEVEGVLPVLLNTAEHPESAAAPLYAAAHNTLTRDVKKGALITSVDF
ncbi:homoserine dehydrogenase [Nesterenkonia halotolerans]|uniref:Homoserine dehydrogenase-like protein n=1 Tax=Nesterenkonia halotolerans TaxID=225325 RepID=A0ABR9J643_9MICC|nr:homoserine dehydrogenase [Nesterenkonia halotolerans]MBE1514449.1 putative homoserine dehydrogenase-like protein [Nesterenkonia halotolerans]